MPFFFFFLIICVVKLFFVLLLVLLDGIFRLLARLRLSVLNRLVRLALEEPFCIILLKSEEDNMISSGCFPWKFALFWALVNIWLRQFKVNAANLQHWTNNRPCIKKIKQKQPEYMAKKIHSLGILFSIYSFPLVYLCLTPTCLQYDLLCFTIEKH